MRSATPKVLHPLCGRPMLLHVLDALEQLPLERIVVVVGHAAEHVTKTLQEQLARRRAGRVRRAARANGAPATPSASRSPPSPTTSTLEDDLLVVCAATSRCCAPETLARARHRAPRRPTPPRPCSPPASPTPPGYGRIVRDDQGRVDRIVEQADATPGGARDRRGQPVDLLLPPRPARAGAAPAQPRERPGRVLPHRRRRGAAPGRARGASGSRPTTPPTRSASTTAPSSRRPRRSCGTASTPRWMRAGVGMTDPARTYVDTAVVLEPDVRLLPGTILSGRTVVRRRLGDRARHAARRHRRRATTRSCARPSAREAEIGDRATVGPFVSLRPGTRLAADAHVGTFVEIKNSRDRRGGQGAAPRLRGRRRDRAPGQHRRREHHRQLRRPAASTAPRSARTCAPGRTRCWSRRSRSATARTPAPARS